MICAKSLVVSPNASNERISRSNETDGSPASILATRDWLDFSRTQTQKLVNRSYVPAVGFKLLLFLGSHA
jgi:hypothetical protein